MKTLALFCVLQENGCLFSKAAGSDLDSELSDEESGVAHTAPVMYLVICVTLKQFQGAFIKFCIFLSELGALGLC